MCLCTASARTNRGCLGFAEAKDTITGIAAPGASKCCFTVFASSGKLFSYVARAVDADPDVKINLDFFYPEGIDASVAQAGIQDPTAGAEKYGCAALVNLVVRMPYSKAGFDLPNPVRAQFIEAITDVIRAASSADPLPLFTSAHLTNLISTQTDMAVQEAEIDVVIEARALAESMGRSSLKLHQKIARRLTRASIDAALARVGLSPVVAVVTEATVDNYGRNRFEAGSTTPIHPAADYHECVSNSQAGDVVKLAGGSPNHVTLLLEWRLQSHQGTSCRSKDDPTRWIVCTADNGYQICDPTSPCQRRKVKPVKVCYRARQVQPHITDAALFQRVYGRPPTTESCAVCFALRIASRPFFIERAEVGAALGSTHPSEMLPLSVNSSVRIELVVADDLGGRAYVYLEENPGAPGGSSMTASELVSYNGQQFQGNAYRRFFLFTPLLMQVGSLSTVCFVAVNDNAMQSDKRCYTLDVRPAVVKWESRAVAGEGFAVWVWETN